MLPIYEKAEEVFLKGNDSGWADFVTTSWLLAVKLLYGGDSREWRYAGTWHDGRWTKLIKDLESCSHIDESGLKQSLPAQGTPELRLGVATIETIFRIGNGKPLVTEGKKPYFGIVRVRRQRSCSRQTCFNAEKYHACFPISLPKSFGIGLSRILRMITNPSDIYLS